MYQNLNTFYKLFFKKNLNEKDIKLVNEIENNYEKYLKKFLTRFEIKKKYKKEDIQELLLLFLFFLIKEIENQKKELKSLNVFKNNNNLKYLHEYFYSDITFLYENPIISKHIIIPKNSIKEYNDLLFYVLLKNNEYFINVILYNAVFYRIFPNELIFNSQILSNLSQIIYDRIYFFTENLYLHNIKYDKIKILEFFETIYILNEKQRKINEKYDYYVEYINFLFNLINQKTDEIDSEIKFYLNKILLNKTKNQFFIKNLSMFYLFFTESIIKNKNLFVILKNEIIKRKSKNIENKYFEKIKQLGNLINEKNELKFIYYIKNNFNINKKNMIKPYIKEKISIKLLDKKSFEELFQQIMEKIETIDNEIIENKIEQLDKKINKIKKEILEYKNKINIIKEFTNEELLLFILVFDKAEIVSYYKEKHSKDIVKFLFKIFYEKNRKEFLNDIEFLFKNKILFDRMFYFYKNYFLSSLKKVKIINEEIFYYILDKYIQYLNVEEPENLIREDPELIKLIDKEKNNLKNKLHKNILNFFKEGIKC